jgi:hypothetical protein
VKICVVVCQTQSSFDNALSASTSVHALPVDARQLQPQQQQRDVDEIALLIPVFKLLLCLMSEARAVQALVGLGLVKALAAKVQHKILDPLLHAAAQASPRHLHPSQSKTEGLELALAILERCSSCEDGRRALVQDRVTYTILAELNLQPGSLIPEATTKQLLHFCESLEANCKEAIAIKNCTDESVSAGHERSAEESSRQNEKDVEQDAGASHVQMADEVRPQDREEVDDILLQGSQDLCCGLRRFLSTDVTFATRSQSASADLSSSQVDAPDDQVGVDTLVPTGGSSGTEGATRLRPPSRPAALHVDDKEGCAGAGEIGEASGKEAADDQVRRTHDQGIIEAFARPESQDSSSIPDFNKPEKPKLLPSGRKFGLANAVKDTIEGAEELPSHSSNAKHLKLLPSGRRPGLANAVRDEIEGNEVGGQVVNSYRVALDSYSIKDRKRDISNLMEIAFDQAEDQWESNISWLVDAKRKSISMQKLQEWNWVRQLARRRVLASGLAAALFDEATKNATVARAYVKFKKTAHSPAKALSPTRTSANDAAGGATQQASPLIAQSPELPRQDTDNHMEMHRIISRARSIPRSRKNLTATDEALSESAQPSSSGTKIRSLGPMALRALRRIDSAITAFNVNDEMRHALVRMGVSRPRKEPDSGLEQSGAKLGFGGSMLSEELKFALSPWRTGKALAEPVRAIIRLSAPVGSALERFQRAVKTTTLLLRISKSQQVMMAIKEILQGDIADTSALTVQRLFRRRKQEALEQGRIFGKLRN